jgi:RNA recognition motif-containing protein
MNIYVGNLPYAVNSQDLRSLFEQYGAVDSASVIADKFTGKSRGYGFVEMPNGEEGNRAIEAINGSELSGRALVVNEARPRQDRPAGPNGGGEFRRRREG